MYGAGEKWSGALYLLVRLQVGTAFQFLKEFLKFLLPGDISIVLLEEAAMPGDYLYMIITLTDFITNIFIKQWVTIWSTFNYFSPGRAELSKMCNQSECVL